MLRRPSAPRYSGPAHHLLGVARPPVFSGVLSWMRDDANYTPIKRPSAMSPDMAAKLIQGDFETATVRENIDSTKRSKL